MSVTISSILAFVISQIVGDTVDQEAIGNFIEVGGLIIFSALAWWGRVRVGDVTWYGMKK